MRRRARRSGGELSRPQPWRDKLRADPGQAAAPVALRHASNGSARKKQHRESVMIIILPLADDACVLRQCEQVLEDEKCLLSPR
jgi:hypothetical protein